MLCTMFVRVKSTPNSPRKSVQIVASKRHGSRIRQHIVRHVGIAQSDEELPHLKHYAQIIIAQMQQQRQASLFTPEETAEQIRAARGQDKAAADAGKIAVDQLRGETVVTLGIHDVYGAIYEQLQLHRILPQYRYTASNRALFHTVMARIANPDSKRASVRRLEQQFGVSVALERIYRMMDQLDEKKIERLQRIAADQVRCLFPEPVKVLFFDCTTLYFESFVDDELRQPGYSKDAKFKESQVLLALMVTPQGLPLGYELLPGATYEGHSLLPLVEKLRQRFEISHAVVVADRGMLSKDNLESLEAAGIDYIVGARLKQLPAKLQTTLLDLSGYAEMEDGVQRCMELQHGTRRVIVSYCPKRARKDGHERDKALRKLLKRLKKSDNPTELMSSYGHRRFIRLTGSARVELDAQKIASAKRWDGLHGVMTSLPEMPAAEILSHYHGLWQVEQTFRITKHDLKIRPMFHWTPRRVRAHVAISFMALMCVRHLQYRIGLQQGGMSVEMIRQALLGANYSIMRDEHSGRRFAVAMQLCATGRKLYRAMGIEREERPLMLQEG